MLLGAARSDDTVLQLAAQILDEPRAVDSAASLAPNTSPSRPGTSPAHHPTTYKESS
jgi:hypothetical protein